MTVLSLPDLRILGSSPARGSLRVYSVRIGYSGRKAAQLFVAYRENQLRGDNYLDIHRQRQVVVPALVAALAGSRPQ